MRFCEHGNYSGDCDICISSIVAYKEESKLNTNQFPIGYTFNWMARKVHVCAKFHDDNDDYIVVWRWRNHKQRREYEVIPVWLAKTHLKQGS